MGRLLISLTAILLGLCLIQPCTPSREFQHTLNSKTHKTEKVWKEGKEGESLRINQAEPTGSHHRTGNSLKDGPKQKWNYTEVREHAHMFWWLYYTTHAAGYKKRPLVIWLQGGPGASSTGYGNFEEIGPETVNLKPRQSTWLAEASLLFVDNPVGTGYSYVTSDDAYATDISTIGADLTKMMTSFLEETPEFQEIPVYIFSESYGGKMAAAFGKSLYEKIESGLKCNLAGVAMGDSWISPIDSVMTWGPFLYSTSLVDEAGLKAVMKAAQATKDAVDNGQWVNATMLWSNTESVISERTNGVNFYNIIKQAESLSRRILEKPYSSPLARMILSRYEQNLDWLMNNPIKQKLGIIPANVTWGGQSSQVFEKQATEFMKPVIDIVDDLLKTNLKVVVYSGQLDLIVDTVGTEMWVQKLSWPDLLKYKTAERLPLTSKEGRTAAFVKSYKNFSFYWIMDAGHMIPSDQPETALQMLRRIIN